MPKFPEKSRRRLKIRFLTIFLTILNLGLVGDDFSIEKSHFFIIFLHTALHRVRYTGDSWEKFLPPICHLRFPLYAGSNMFSMRIAGLKKGVFFFGHYARIKINFSEEKPKFWFLLIFILPCKCRSKFKNNTISQHMLRVSWKIFVEKNPIPLGFFREI